ncbi:hypothetical protein [Pseudomonas sp. CFBP 13719]|nr:hypothetical protein [Pseudomonas sp. CFBP 13719]MBD8681218.1 hypothetical protein [Pseudomonas sp. CFBP 13719]
MNMLAPIELPPAVFAEAVRLANLPNLDRKGWRIAIEHLTSWWNSTADVPYQGAYGLSLYVRFGDDWLSGNPEECWVSGAQWALAERPLAQAGLLNGDVSITFQRQAEDIGGHSFEAKAVDGSHGTSGGLVEGSTGNDTLDEFSFEVLSIFPVRYPDAWAKILDQFASASAI